jgi:thiamine-phosphate pyrophosphorylase
VRGGPQPPAPSPGGRGGTDSSAQGPGSDAPPSLPRKEAGGLGPSVAPLPPLMLVTDGQFPAHPAGANRLTAAVSGGVGIIQLRDRAAGAAELLERALRLRRLLPETLLLVNDRVDVALAAGAGGVQLGAGALPAPAARRLLGPGALIGRSVHSAAEARTAEGGGADFLVVGTIYPTTTHPGKVVEGPELINTVAAAVQVPFFAIGGITAATAGECVRRGAHGVAVIRAIGEAVDPRAAARDILAAMRGQG